MVRKFLFFVMFLILCGVTKTFQARQNSVKLSLTISAVSRQLQVSWFTSASISPGDLIVITKQKPKLFQINYFTENSSSLNESGAAGQFVPIICNNINSDAADLNKHAENGKVECSETTAEILYTIQPRKSNDWTTTTVPFNFSLTNEITINIKCYGYWASYINVNGTILSTDCIKAYPTWMNDMKNKIENFRFRDLMIPGTHDSASYRPGFNPLAKETLVTKYSLTQDEDIRGQLMHGIRYLDIRVGYYGATDELFWANHGISKLMPLNDVIQQVKEFVRETNEIIIFDIQEFPIGFGKSLDIHHLFVQFLRDRFGDVLVDPRLSWQAKLREIWHRKKNVLLCYDYSPVVDQYPDMLFTSVEQKWGDVQSWEDLEKFLIRANQQSLLRSSGRPVADMAELTPDTWGVIVDKYGGLRTLADSVNPFVSELYRVDLGHSANVVAVDFFRGTSIVETALYWNSKKVAR